MHITFSIESIILKLAMFFRNLPALIWAKSSRSWTMKLMMLEEFSWTLRPFFSLSMWSWIWVTASSFLSILLSNISIYSYKCIFSMFYAFIEFSGFRSSWLTHAFIKLKNSLCVFSWWYRIFDEISIIWKSCRYWPFRLKGDSFIYTYCFGLFRF